MTSNAAAQVAPTQSIPAIGTEYGGGTVTGIVSENGQQYLVITAGKAHELRGELGTYGQDVEGAHSYTDGRANTEALAAAGSELAQKVLALEIGGFSDWAIPARDQQELQYRHLKPTARQNYAGYRDGDNPSSVPPGYPYTEDLPAKTDVSAFQDNGAEAFAEEWYWSSTQSSADTASSLGFSDGLQLNSDKFLEARVRPVRSELIQ
ncbi:DUF1566 domain-containing protein [Azotobacter vinelandii]